MDLTFTDAEQRFRAEARDWLRAHAEELPSMDTREGFAAHRAWERTLYDAGYAAVSWPREYGGRGASLIEWLLFEEEYYAAGAPRRVSQNGVFLLAPTLLEFGTDQQRTRFLPRMARGDDVWAQAWSEPEAGSDLASLRAHATRGDGGWRLHGQKTWSSRAAFADWAFGLFRTDPLARPRHRGLTYFLVRLDSPGVTVRPIAQLDGEPGFAEIFFDGAYVPDTDVLGAVGDGWRVAMTTASSERGLTLRSPGRFLATAAKLVDVYRQHPDPALRHDVARAWADAQAYRLHTFAAACHPRPGANTSMTKVFWSELDVRLHDIALQLLGQDVTPDWLDGYLFALAGPIYAGTNEIQRNVVAERVLGLPREPR